MCSTRFEDASYKELEKHIHRYVDVQHKCKDKDSNIGNTYKQHTFENTNILHSLDNI